MALRSVPIRRAGNRTTLLLGGDRKLVLLTGLIAVPLPLLGQTWYAVAYAVVLWFGALGALRSMAKSDTRLRDVYFRHRLYAEYYPARSTPFRVNGRFAAKRYS